jgi:threonine-phosphate decarboxylase
MEITFDRHHGGVDISGALIDFSVSTNPFGAPPAVIDAYHRAAATIGVYPEPYAATLTTAIANHLNVAPVNVLVGNGSTQLFYLIARVLRARRPFVVIPTFSEIANSLLAMAAAPRSVMLRRDRDFQFDLGDICRGLADGADALFLGRPNSPTGTTVDLAMVSAIAERCAASRCWCVIDEAFIDFADDPASAVALIKEFERMIVVRSMTKLYAIPGLRLGYLVASADIVGELARALEPWSVSGPAAAVGIVCLAQPDGWREEIRGAIRAERGFLTQQLATFPGLAVYPSSANFLMFNMRTGGQRVFSSHMRECGIVVRDLAALPGAGPGLYRIAVRSRSDNLLLLEAVRSHLKLRVGSICP